MNFSFFFMFSNGIFLVVNTDWLVSLHCCCNGQSDSNSLWTSTWLYTIYSDYFEGVYANFLFLYQVGENLHNWLLEGKAPSLTCQESLLGLDT